MSETLEQSALSQSMQEKRVAETYDERRKAVAKQITRINNRIVARASESGLSDGHYGGKDAYSMSKKGPFPDTKLRTKVEYDDFGHAHVDQMVDATVGKTGISVSTTERGGLDAVLRTRSGGQENHKRLEGEHEIQAINNVPGQLAEARGALANEEIDKQKRDEEYEQQYPRAA